MKLRGCVCAFFFVLIVSSANAQADKPFPTEDEIKLLLAQTDRAVQQYKPLIEQEASLLGASDAVVKDQQVVTALETAVKALRTKPQGFNSPLGFALFEWIDDASRNALLCSTGASTQAIVNIMAGNSNKADALAHLAQSCMDAATLVYTVSENAGSLYDRYAEAEEQLALKGYEVAQRCTDVLKSRGIAPK